MKKTNKFVEDSKRFRFFTENTTKCKCGRSAFLGSRDKIICSWCGEYIFKNKKDEFLYRVGEILKK